MTEVEFEQKVNEEISRLVSLMLGYLMLKHSSGIAGDSMVKLVTSEGFSQRIILTLKAAVEKETARIEQAVLDIGSGVAPGPDGVRVIAGFTNENTAGRKTSGGK